MSKAVSTDHEFNKDKLSELLQKAKGGRTQTQFAKDSGLSVAYVCKYLNSHFANAPIPSTLKKIAEVAANGVTYEQLLDAAGYDSTKYAEDPMLVKQNLENSQFARNKTLFHKLAFATITDALRTNNIKCTYAPSNSTGDSYYDYDFEVEHNTISHWYFKSYYSANPSASYDSKDIEEYYSKLIFLSGGNKTKFSFITNTSALFNAILSALPASLYMYVSVILIEGTELNVTKEEYVKTALSDNSDLPRLA